MTYRSPVIHIEPDSMFHPLLFEAPLDFWANLDQSIAQHLDSTEFVVQSWDNSIFLIPHLISTT